MIYECKRCGEWETLKRDMVTHLKREHKENEDKIMGDTQWKILKGKAAANK